MNPIDPITYKDIEAYRDEVVKAISKTSPDFYRNFKVIALDNSKDVVCFAVEKAGTRVIDLVGSGTLETVIGTCALFQDGIPSKEVIDAVAEEKVKILATKLIKRIPLPDTEL
jgi:hypothetical protein